MACYDQDLAECRVFERSIKPAKTKKWAGRASGAVVGGPIGAIAGDAGKAAGVAHWRRYLRANEGPGMRW